MTRVGHGLDSCPLSLLLSLLSLFFGLLLCLLLGRSLHQFVTSATRLLVKLGDLDFEQVVHVLDEIGRSNALPVNFVSTIAVVAAASVVARRHDESKVYEGKKMG